MKRFISHITCFVALMICAVYAPSLYTAAEPAGIESVIPVSVGADGSGTEYTIVMRSPDTGTRKAIKVREGEKGAFTVTHYSPGTYVYTIAEDTPDMQYITPDSTEYRAYVCVTQNDNRQLFSSVSLQKAGGTDSSEKSDQASFSNILKKPDEKIKEKVSPQTGDSTGIRQLISMFAGALFTIIILVGVHRRGRKHMEATGRTGGNAK